MTAWWGGDPGPHSPGAARFDVGKRCGEPSPSQAQINALLLALARTGKRVVRLKGAILVFGRGGEEALHLARHGIAAELVPGITAALGCAASSLIPLTHRGWPAPDPGHRPPDGRGRLSGLAGADPGRSHPGVLHGAGAGGRIRQGLLAVVPHRICRWRWWWPVAAPASKSMRPGWTGWRRPPWPCSARARC